MYIGTESNKDTEANDQNEEQFEFDEDLYKRRHEEGYDIYDESYVRWLKLYHPDDIKKDWLSRLEASQKSSTNDVPQTFDATSHVDNDNDVDNDNEHLETSEAS